MLAGDTTVAFLADFYQQGGGRNASCRAKVIVSTEDLAPEFDGDQRVWIEGVGCESSGLQHRVSRKPPGSEEVLHRRVERRTHDDTHNGTATLLAAPDLATGKAERDSISTALGNAVPGRACGASRQRAAVGVINASSAQACEPRMASGLISTSRSAWRSNHTQR